jgi:DNA-binding response OmpR family regulator
MRAINVSLSRLVQGPEMIDSKSMSKVDSAISSMDSNEKEQVLSNFESFKSYLGKRIQLAENIGLNEEHLAAIAMKIADYLAAHEDPRNSEEKLLQELWKVGKPEEQHMLAHMLVRMAQEAS